MALLWKLAGATLIGVLLAAAVARFTGAAPSDLPPEAYAGSLSEWTDDDFRQLAAVAGRVRANPADLLLVMTSESGLHPWAKNPLGAAGLFQLTTVSNAATGLTEAQRLDIARGSASLPYWPVSEQLPLGERIYQATPWFRAGRAYTHVGTVYGNIFAPGRLMSRGDALDAVLFDESDDTEKSKPYANNAKAFDPKGTGAITVGGLVDHLRSVAKTSLYLNALLRLRAATGHTFVPNLPKE